MTSGRRKPAVGLTSASKGSGSSGHFWKSLPLYVLSFPFPMPDIVIVPFARTFSQSGLSLEGAGFQKEPCVETRPPHFLLPAPKFRPNLCLSFIALHDGHVLFRLVRLARRLDRLWLELLLRNPFDHERPPREAGVG